jgi:hypothetical protein
LKTSFRGYTDAGFEKKAQLIVAMVTANFKDPDPEIAVLLESIDAYSDALTAAGNGDRVLIAHKNKCRKELETLLRQLAAFVTMVAKGDRDILVSSGFDLAKEAEPKPAVTAPTTIKVSSGNNPGEVVVKVSGAKNHKHYRHEYTVGPLTENSVWIDKVNSKSKHLFTGLKTSVEHFFRSGALGKDDAVAYSKVVSYIVQ